MNLLKACLIKGALPLPCSDKNVENVKMCLKIVMQALEEILKIHIYIYKIV